MVRVLLLGLIAISLLICCSVTEATAALLNGGFEEVDASGSLSGWRVFSRLDPNLYGPELKESFDAIVPAQCRSGRAGSEHCAGFPATGTWLGKVSEHHRANGTDLDGEEFGKAALSQVVTLEPGVYTFGAYLRTAGGAAFSACFDLGWSKGDDAGYAHDGSTGIQWTKNDLGLNRSYDGTGDLRERGEWLEYETQPFTIEKRGPVTVWIRFNYTNNGPMPARWQVDDAFVRPYTPPVAAESVAAAKPSIGSPMQRLNPGQMLADCGDVEGGYLSADNGSTVRGSIPRRMFQHARCATSDSSFTYSFPVDPAVESVYVAFEHMGPCKVVFSGRVERTDTGAAEDAIFPKQYLLTDRSLWKSGRLHVTFSSPIHDKQVAVVWVEAGTTTRFRERVKNVVWDTTSTAWSVGLWDSSSREFRGEKRDVTIGSSYDHSELSGRDLRIEWTQSIRPECRYYVVLGHIRTIDDTTPLAKINIGDDELVEWVSTTRGQEIFEVDATEYLREGRNVVSVSAETIDFVALVVQTPGITDNRKLKLYFGGNDDAENLTRVCHNTLFWLLSLHYDDSGFIDASVPHGKWWQQYWPIDIAFAMRAMLHWGYLDETDRMAALVADVAWSGHQSNRSGGHDNNGGNILAVEMCELMRRRAFEPELVARVWPTISEYCDTLCDQAAASPFGLIKGTNWENAGNREQGPCYALTTNISAAGLLLKAADTAEEGGMDSHADKWRASAAQIREKVLQQLVFTEDVKSPTGWIYPKGTWAYGLLDDGSFMMEPLAGYFWAGMQGTSCYGFIDNDPTVRALYNRTVDASLPAFEIGRVDLISGYAASYDSGGMVLGCAALSDRLDIIEKMIPELIKETDYLRDVGQPRAELSRWAYGPPGWEEDTNLVGAAAFLDTARFITGVDDILYEGAQVCILPRLPASWNECGVNSWTVQYRTGGGRGLTNLSYHYRLTDGRAEFRVQSDDEIAGLAVRVGPFPMDESARAVTVDDRPLNARVEDSGGYRWLWVELDSGPRERVVRVR